MASDNSADDILISRLGHQPREIMEGMLQVTKSAKTTSLKRRGSIPFGDLDSLPVELLHWIFSMLDLRTLSRITQTCLRGIAVVNSVPEYRDLLRHASKAMAALGSTRLLRHHSAHTLHAVLLSSACSSCGMFGPFLFLPTCERCCHGCLKRNQNLWMITYADARETFGLNQKSLRTLPVLHSLTEQSFSRWRTATNKRYRLVSVKAATEVAAKTGKSQAELAIDLENQYSPLSGDRGRYAEMLRGGHYYKLHWILRAPLQAPGESIVWGPGQPDRSEDEFCGMASVPYPVLCADGRIEDGLWCLGCDMTDREYDPYSNPHQPLSLLITSRVQTMQYVARSREEFLDHLAGCSGIKAMVQRREEFGDLEVQLNCLKPPRRSEKELFEHIATVYRRERDRIFGSPET